MCAKYNVVKTRVDQLLLLLQVFYSFFLSPITFPTITFLAARDINIIIVDNFIEKIRLMRHHRLLITLGNKTVFSVSAFIFGTIFVWL